MSTRSFKCLMEVTGNKLSNQNPVGYKQFLSLLEEGEKLTVEFKRKRFEKTNPQLRLAYRLLSTIKDETGNTIEGLDAWVKHKMGKCFIEKVKEEEILNCKSKADFTKEEMEEYINILTQLALEYKILLYPDEDQEMSVHFAD